MAATVKDVLSAAKSHLGQGAGAFGFNADWCVYFLGYIFREANALDALPEPLKSSAAAGTMGGVSYVLDNIGTIYDYDNAQPGDFIFYGNGSGSMRHIGIVLAHENGVVTTIEGNTGSENYWCSSVRQKDVARDPGWAKLYGFGRPNYIKDSSGEIYGNTSKKEVQKVAVEESESYSYITEDFFVDLCDINLLLAKNTTKEELLAKLPGMSTQKNNYSIINYPLQKRLNYLGYSVKQTGIYNAETASAVKALQKEHGLPQNGAIGAKGKIWRILLNM